MDAKHEWSVWEGVEGITVLSRLAGVSRTVWLRRFFIYKCKKTSYDETILGSAFPLFGLNCKYIIQN